MSEQPKPRKPRQPKSKRLNINAKARWESILREVTKDEVPVSVLHSVCVHLTDGTDVTVNIKELLSDGHDPDDIRAELDAKLEALDHIIDDVDFNVSIDTVAKTIQPITDKLLKHL
jgi:hypothetical protein